MHLSVLLRAGAIAAALSLLALLTIPARADTAPPALLSVSGSAEIAVRPDRATITSGVVTEAETARAALDENSSALARVIAALRQAGIEDRDIATSGFSVEPRYHYPQSRDGRSEPPRIVGYQVTNQVTVRVRDLGRLGSVLDQAVSEGANRVQGIAFEVSGADRLLDEARAEAVRDARRKAEIYAEAGGFELVRIHTLSEAERSGEPPRPLMARAMSFDTAESVPVEAGERTLSIRVDISWEIGD
jgi:uncharacterized protein